jgi:hypothetical protein
MRFRISRYSGTENSQPFIFLWGDLPRLRMQEDLPLVRDDRDALSMTL